MNFRVVILHSGLVTVACLALTGCLGNKGESTSIRKPAMPTMAPAPSAAPLSVSDNEIIANVFGLVRNNNMAAALAALESVGDVSRRGRMGIQVVTQLAEPDPVASAAFASALPAEPWRTSGLEIAARAFARRDPDAALRWALGLSDENATRAARHVVATELVRTNRRTTIDQILALPASPVRDDMLIMAAAAWTRLEPNEAVSWLRGLPDDELKPRLTSGVAFELAQTHPDRAIAVAELLPAGRNRWLLFSAIAQTWVAIDSKAAVAWAGQLPAGEPRDAAFAGVDTGLGLPRSRRLAGATGTRGSSSRTRGGGAAVAALTAADSPEFTAWLATQRPGMSRDEAILEYVRQRGVLEPSAIGPWLAGLPGGTTRDRALEIYVEGIAIRSPSEAARWVRSLPRSDRSDELIEKTARRWLTTNPDAAAAWIEESTLSLDRKRQLLREAGR